MHFIFTCAGLQLKICIENRKIEAKIVKIEKKFRNRNKIEKISIIEWQ